MKKDIWNEAFNSLDSELIAKYMSEKESAVKRQRRKRIFLRALPFAACFCLIVSLLVAVPMILNNDTEKYIHNGSQSESQLPQGSSVSTQITDGGATNSSNGTTDSSNGATDSSNGTTDSSNSTTDSSNGAANIAPDQNMPTTDPSYTQSLLNATVSPDLIFGSAQETVKGSPSDGSSGAPPGISFGYNSLAVVARAVEIYPDIYTDLNSTPKYNPTEYRLVMMEVIEVINGEGIPKYFLYMISNYRCVDFTVYDALVISMKQKGTVGYVLKNETQNKIEAFDMPVFSDIYGNPSLGGMYAFTGGIFDESLWQTPSWIYGYQFAKMYLDKMDETHEIYYDMVVYRGCSLDFTLSMIDQRNERYEKEPSVKTLDSATGEAITALEYVKPFENGVFAPYFINNLIVYVRFINGIQTEETVRINLDTWEVEYSEVKYTREDLESIENIALYLEKKAELYKTETPLPPRVNPEGKTLNFLNLYGWYVKTEDGVYGVICTTWQYLVKNGYYHSYIYDDTYTLYGNNQALILTNQELIDILGSSRNVYTGLYDTEIEIPLE